MFQNPSVEGMAGEFAAPGQENTQMQAGQASPGGEEGIDPGEALEFFLMKAQDDKKAAQAVSEFIQAIGESRFEQLLEGGNWSPQELELLQQVAMAMAPGGPEEGQNPAMQGQAPMPQPEPGMY
jgi:hypothetical protein